MSTTNTITATTDPTASAASGGAVAAPSSGRLQLALNVADLAASIDFYSRLFGVGPAKVRPGYANFAIEQPPLKLVLVEGDGPSGTINHLGVEVADRGRVADAHERVTAAGLGVWVEGETTCCFAVQDKFWVDGGDHRWEIYTVLRDAEEMVCDVTGTCAPESPAAVAEPSADGGVRGCC